LKYFVFFIALFPWLLWSSEVKPLWLQGEKLNYTISWGFITAGTALMEVRPLADGKTEIWSFARNNGLFEQIYPVADTVYSRMRNEEFLPEVFKKTLHEGSYHNKSVIRFDRAGGKAWLSDTVFTDPVKRKIKRSTDTVIAITGWERCILTAFYLVRTMDLEVGKETRFSAVSGKKRYDLRVVVHSREKVKTDAGTFDCIKVEPILDGDGLFNASGRLFIWLSDDEKRLPVLMKSEITLGSIRAELTNFELKLPAGK
jgi:hypothetical protein